MEEYKTVKLNGYQLRTIRAMCTWTKMMVSEGKIDAYDWQLKAIDDLMFLLDQSTLIYEEN